MAPSAQRNKRPSEEALTAPPTKRPKTNSDNNNNGATSKQRPPKKGGQTDGSFNRSGKGAPPPDNRNRAKIYEIRSIAVQKSDAALRDGELNVQSFLNARSFELNALDESMRRTRTSKTSRAFQRVPITLRRRAGAHNHKRVPKRLQKRARKEMIQDNTPTVNSRTRKSSSTRSRLRAETAKRLEILAKNKRLRRLQKAGVDKETITVRAARPKIRRNALNNPPVTATKFRKRQLDKTWLPTHLWHTKRARMTAPKEPLWRFVIPLTPTAKCYRPTHRVQWEKGAIAWDISYMSTISLSGPLNSVRNVLKALGLTHENLWNDKGACWRSGAVHWTSTLSRKTQQGFVQIIGPATIIWNPESTSDGPGSSNDFKRLFIRLHPSAFLETFDELRRLVKKQNPRPFIEDLRHEIGSIEITGSDSTESLLGILKPYVSETHSKEPQGLKFEKLAGCRDPASLPLGSLLAFSIMDPRLRYPPQKMPPTKADIDALGDFHKDPCTTPFQLFDRDARFKASQLPAQKDLNRRRGKGSPGARLEPTARDPQIPVILLASRHPKDPQAPGTWTLILPWKCVLPVWHSLMHCPLSSGGNPRFGGLNELRQLTFERGLPWFPGDFPGTGAGNAWETSQRLHRQQKWGRMPKGKRVNYETLDLGAGRKGEVGVGWSCDFETLLELNKNTGAVAECEPDKMQGVVPTTTGEDGTITATATEETSVLQEGKKKKKKKSEQPENSPLENLTYLPKATFTTYVGPKSEPPPPASVITVQIKLLGRGTVSTCARIYRLPDEAAKDAAPLEEAAAAAAAGGPSSSFSWVGGSVTNKSQPPQLPPNLREQWLAQKPDPKKGGGGSCGKKNNQPKTAAIGDVHARARMLARELLVAPTLHQDNNDHHPPCPGAEHLVGFVTTGSYNLRDGRAAAVGALSATAARDEMRRYAGDRSHSAARLCVVRNAGEVVGRLARWEVV
ncbi:Ribonucleases P/MRP protein subunit pop1 [Diatrype stigma]|uniref:Ribonucleases P/MRP protein subunit pop1 n=1 Tax=Diatrype stigma TaxID=117547 RepID=A0AAN9YX33_9PEZI